MPKTTRPPQARDRVAGADDLPDGFVWLSIPVTHAEFDKLTKNRFLTATGTRWESARQTLGFATTAPRGFTKAMKDARKEKKA